MKTILLVCVLVFAVGCKSNDKPASGSTARGTTAPAAPGPAGATGSGDKSGNSIPNAMPVEQGKTANANYPCEGSLVIGPFAFTKDPTKLRVAVKANNKIAEQACLGGNWVDAKGVFVAVAGVGCLDPGSSHESTLEIEYSPGNGGNNTNPVYLDLRYGDTKPATCKPLPLELRLQ